MGLAGVSIVSDIEVGGAAVEFPMKGIASNQRDPVEKGVDKEPHHDDDDARDLS